MIAIAASVLLMIALIYDSSFDTVIIALAAIFVLLIAIYNRMFDILKELRKQNRSVE